MDNIKIVLERSTFKDLYDWQKLCTTANVDQDVQTIVINCAPSDIGARKDVEQ